ncbi:MAG: hypothetical protein KF912_11795 [Phycisphaeraceae bacterium]|nr:hypothetical protein [Phycisphaeraceae bacterium]MBX3367984.1 hypothetical protein [Phycisphaeraceae bacterium]
MKSVDAPYLLAVVILCLAVGRAHAQPSVQIISGDEVNFDVQQVAAGVYGVIIVSNDVDSTQVRIVPNGGTYTLGIVAVAIPNASGNCTLYIDDDPFPGAFLSVEYVFPFDYDGGEPDLDGELFVVIDIDGTLGVVNQPGIGFVAAHSIASVSANSGISAHLFAGPRDDPISSWISILQTDGDLLADVWVPKGRIETLVVGGNIGSSENPVSINTQDRIGFLSASRIWADINTTYNGGSGEVRTLLCTVGNFVGSLTSNRVLNSTVNDKIEIAGDCDADLLFTATASGSVRAPIIVHGDLPSGRFISVASYIDALSGNRGAITIKGSLEGDIFIGAANGLKGQIIIDSDNTGDDWDGDVIIGAGTVSPITIGPSQSQPNDAPYYEMLSSAIGDGTAGAIGLVPFNFHPKDSSPDNDAFLSTAQAPDYVDIWHYGPVKIVGSSAPVTVEVAEVAYPVDGSPTWTDVTNDYTYAVQSNKRVLRITPKEGESFGPGHMYRVKPVSGNLQCDIAATVNVEYDAPSAYAWFDDYYRFKIFHSFDLSMNGFVGYEDVEMWNNEPSDVNLDDEVNSMDLADIILNIDE